MVETANLLNVRTLHESRETRTTRQFLRVIIQLLKPNYNVTPSQLVPAVRNHVEGEREFVTLKWGLVPSWAKPSIGYKMINARIETLTTKPSFRTAVRRRRCLILAGGWYEWKREGKAKQPYYFRMKKEQPFMFAGMWESWASKKETIELCTIITMPANDFMSQYHHRMPYVLPREFYDMWLDHGEESRALDLTRIPL